VVGVEPRALNSACVALFYGLADSPTWDGVVAELRSERVFAVVITTRDLLDAGVWRVAGVGTPVVPDSPYEQFRRVGPVGCKVFGSANVVELSRVMHGLKPTKTYADPGYLSRLLLPGWTLGAPPPGRFG
jgi:hypothetical protein